MVYDLTQLQANLERKGYQVQVFDTKEEAFLEAGRRLLEIVSVIK